MYSFYRISPISLQFNISKSVKFLENVVCSSWITIKVPPASTPLPRIYHSSTAAMIMAITMSSRRSITLTPSFLSFISLHLYLFILWPLWRQHIFFSFFLVNIFMLFFLSWSMLCQQKISISTKTQFLSLQGFLKSNLECALHKFTVYFLSFPDCHIQ